MLGFSLGLNGRRKLGGLLPQTVALFARAAAEGFDLPSDACKEAINYDISQQISSGIWAEANTVFYHANDSGSINFGRINAAAPLSDLGTVHGSLSFVNKSGIKGNGTDAYFDTQFAPDSDVSRYIMNSAHVFIYKYANGSGRLTGTVTGIASVLMVETDSKVQRLNSVNNLGSSVDFRVIGTVGMNRVDGSNVDIMINGTQTSQANTATDLPVGNIVFLRQGPNYGNSGISIVRIGSGLTSTQEALINTLDAAYMVKMAAL